METLYNGIVLPDVWPPRDQKPASFQPMRVPYLESPPKVIPINVGRQLFVDNFLIEETHMAQTFHRPVKYPGNPVLFPQTEYERNEKMPPTTIPKCGGLWYDQDEQIFKMWYMASYLGVMAYATSADGVHWERPVLDVVPGTNLILPPDIHPDSGTVWLDRETSDKSQRYKMLLREPNPPNISNIPALMMTSPDGIHWSKPRQTGPMDDRSTMFYNPFRRKWVQSIRTWINPRRRSRKYWEADDFLASGGWKEGEPVFWTGADCMDESGGAPAELYNLDAVAYESVILGFHQIFKGPPNHIGEAVGLPKLTELVLATSRDGFHWHRPDRKAFIGATREPGSWEYGYVESTGGVVLVVGDELWFYYSAYAGDPKRINQKHWYTNGTYANGATGLAKLRRDGFVSMQARFPKATLTTRPLMFSGDRLFVNANTAGATLSVECLGEDNKVMESFSMDDFVPYCGNSTCVEIGWKSKGIGALAGKPVKLRFQMDKGDLYSFWITDSPDGDSHGYCGAGAAI